MELFDSNVYIYPYSVFALFPNVLGFNKRQNLFVIPRLTSWKVHGLSEFKDVTQKKMSFGIFKNSFDKNKNIRELIVIHHAYLRWSLIYLNHVAEPPFTGSNCTLAQISKHWSNFKLNQPCLNRVSIL